MNTSCIIILCLLRMSKIRNVFQNVIGNNKNLNYVNDNMKISINIRSKRSYSIIEFENIFEKIRPGRRTHRYVTRRPKREKTVRPFGDFYEQMSQRVHDSV